MSYVFNKVKEIIVSKLGIAEADVKMESRLREDLGSDSLDNAELVMELEQEFDFRVPDEEAEKLTTVGEIVAYIEKEKPILKT